MFFEICPGDACHPLTSSGNLKKSDFGGLQSPEVRKIKCKNRQELYTCFSFCSKKYRRMI
jgi:hypothetical protein